MSALGVVTAAAALARLASPRPRAATAAPQYRLTIVGSAGTELFGINKNGADFGIAAEKGAKVQEGFLRRAGTTKLPSLGWPGDLTNANSSSAQEATGTRSSTRTDTPPT